MLTILALVVLVGGLVLAAVNWHGADSYGNVPYGSNPTGSLTQLGDVVAFLIGVGAVLAAAMLAWAGYVLRLLAAGSGRLPEKPEEVVRRAPLPPEYNTPPLPRFGDPQG